MRLCDPRAVCLHFWKNWVRLLLVRVSLRPLSCRAANATTDMAGKSSKSHDSLAAFQELTSHSDVAGLVCVVTGGSSGLGLYASQALVLAGATVYILGRNTEALDREVKRLENNAGAGSQGKMRRVVCDVTSKESLSGAVRAVSEEQKEGIDVVICNAGVSGRLMVSLYRAAQPTMTMLSCVLLA